jgi:hypothetical protein
MHDSKRVLVVGNRGSIGRRYEAILSYLNIEHEGYDTSIFSRAPEGSYTHIIIATPTHLHYEHILKYSKEYPEADILCEKPISKNPAEIQDLIDKGLNVRMVCNYLFCEGMRRAGGNTIYYNHYNTGRDGKAWDLIQLIYLAKNMPALHTTNPVFSMAANAVILSLNDVASSYIIMIEEWLDCPDSLWNLNDALKATKKVIEYEKLDSNSGSLNK